MKKALISGITGQDGSYLAELLLTKGYEVHGLVRRSSTFGTERIDHLYRDPHTDAPGLVLHFGDMADGSSIRNVLSRIRPDEVYNLAAQSHVRVSFDLPEYTADVVGSGALRLLEAVRDHRDQTGSQIKVYQAGSSEMFGASQPPQSEKTPFYPRSPYAVSKVAAHWFSINYREAFDLFVCNGILFNHESPRRGETFVTRKITRGLTRIKLGLQDKLYLGNLEARRDWGFAGDYVEAMWLMLQAEKPDDYVIATGESYTVRDFLTRAAVRLKLDPDAVVGFDERYLRPTEVDALVGDASKAREKLGWKASTSFDELVGMMVDHDLELAARERTLLDAGHRV
jgi:GDPmannose 4,6-dehydratase